MIDNASVLRAVPFACIVFLSASIAAAEGGKLKVIVPSAPIKSGQQTLANAGKDQEFRFTDTNGAWYQIEFVLAGAARRGWIHEDHIEVQWTDSDFLDAFDALGLSPTPPPSTNRAPPLTAAQQVQFDEAKALSDRAFALVQQGSADEAFPLLERALALRTAALGSKHPITAASFNELGVLRHAQRRFADAKSYYIQAISILVEAVGDKHPDIATVKLNLSETLEAQGDLAGSRKVLEEALTIQREALDKNDPALAKTLTTLGRVLMGLGDARAAQRRHQQALDIRLNAFGSNHPDTVDSLNNLGLSLAAQADYARALVNFERALGVQSELSRQKHTMTATILNNIGHVLHKRGDLAGARSRYGQALALQTEILGKNHPETAVSLNNLGLLLGEQADYATALTHLEQALTIQTKAFGEMDRHRATILVNISLLLHRKGDLSAARTRLEQALAIQMKLFGEKHLDTLNSQNNLALLLYDQGENADARKHLERIFALRLATLGTKHPDTILSLNNLGSFLQSQGDLAGAHTYLTQAAAFTKEVLGPNHPWTARSLGALADLNIAEQSWDQAVDSMHASRQAARNHIARVLPALSDKEQTMFLAQTDAGSFYAALSLGWMRRGDPEINRRSAEWLLNGKAVAQEALAQRVLATRDAADPVLGETQRALLETRRQLAAVAMSMPSPGQEPARREKLRQLEASEAELSRKLASLQGKTEPDDVWVDLAAVRQAIPTDAVLVDIARFPVTNFTAKGKQPRSQPPRYVAWIIPPAGDGDVSIVELGGALAIDDDVETLRAAFQQAVGTAQQPGKIIEEGEQEAEKALQTPLRNLATLILDPILRKVGDAKRLILSPDASLWLVPWAALPIKDGRYALEQHQMHYVLSGRDLIASRATSVSAAAPVIMADPNFDLSPQQSSAAVRAVLTGALPDRGEPLRSEPLASVSSLPQVARLPGTAAEAKAIAPQLQKYAQTAPTVYTDRYAQEAVFKAVKQPKALVLSTHGFFLPDQEIEPKANLLASSDARSVALTSDGKPVENPLLRCGLLFAGCNNSAQAAAAGGEDGILTGMEIVGADLRGAELVVLSACETALGQVRNGEGVAGLRQAFQLAGAETVVSTLWQIPDQDSAQLMTDFFTNLASSHCEADALRNAQLAMIEHRRGRYSAAHPFFWAAFTLTGNPAMRASNLAPRR